MAGLERDGGWRSSSDISLPDWRSSSEVSLPDWRSSSTSDVDGQWQWGVCGKGPLADVMLIMMS
jgi:hypothetical protein